MNQATFKIDKTSDVKLVQEKVNTEKDKIAEVVKNTEKDKQTETTKNTDITPSIAPIKKPIQKVENIYYL